MPTRPDPEVRATLRRLFVAGVAEATAGVAFLTFSIFYFARVLQLPAGQIGLLLSVGGVAGLLAPLPIGAAADRYGPRRVTAAVLLAEAVVFVLVGLPVAVPVLFVLVCALSAAMRSAGAARTALLATAVPTEHRVRVQAQLRATMFLGAAIGAAGCALVLRADTPLAYRLALLGCATLCLIAVAAVATTPVANRPAPTPGLLRTVARDTPFLVIAGLTAMLGLHDALIMVAVPLVTQTHGIPTIVVPAVIVLQAGLTLALQGKLARRRSTAAAALRGFLHSVVLLAAGCALLLAAATAGGFLAAALVVGAGVVFIIAAMLHAAGAIYLNFALAPDNMIGSYSAVFALARAAQLAAGPFLATTLIVNGALPGTIAFLTILLAALAAFPRALRWAERSRPAAHESRALAPSVPAGTSGSSPSLSG